jgi:hypothetical protein
MLATLRRFVPVFLGAFTLAATPAGAGSLDIGLTSDVNIAPGSDIETFHTLVAAQLALPHVVTSTRSGFGSTSSGSTEVSAGLISMNASSNAADPVAHGYVTNQDLMVTQQTDTATLTETLQVLSTTLALNAPVDLLFTLSFAQAVTSSEPLSGFMTAGYQAALSANDQLIDGLQLNSTALTTGILHTFVGQTIDLSQTMFGGTDAEFFDATERSVEADATGHFYIDTLTSGVTLAAESGHDYATPTAAPVPEPSSLALLSGGMLLVAWSRRATQRRRSLRD